MMAQQNHPNVRYGDFTYNQKAIENLEFKEIINNKNREHASAKDARFRRNGMRLITATAGLAVFMAAKNEIEKPNTDLAELAPRVLLAGCSVAIAGIITKSLNDEKKKHLANTKTLDLMAYINSGDPKVAEYKETFIDARARGFNVVPRPAVA